MSFGSCCILNEQKYSLMKAKSVFVKGEELGLFVNFEVSQTFYHEESTAKEVTYIFPNDLKMCIYDTTFVVGKEIIKPKLKSKEEAKKTYEEAVKKGHTAVYGSNLSDGLTKFKLGNVPPNTDCKVIIKVAFTANVTKQNSFFIKFPLDVCTPNGSKGCLDMISSNFQFQLQCDKEKINKVTSNVNNIHYDNSTKLLTINNHVDNKDNEHSIIITFETQDNVESSVLIGHTMNGYDNCAVTISSNLEEKQNDSSTEFIFVVDCSGSMIGNSIQKARECLELFIRSLPDNSYFNIVRFGSSYTKLFESSIEYNETNIKKALKLATKLRADLGGTEIYTPLKDIFRQKNKFGQRQVFILTDGEVENRSSVLELVSMNSIENRCFTIGIGRGCDAGLVEGIANSSGGKSDFVQSGGSITEKVIPQLESSLSGILTSIEIHIEGEENDSFQISPYPLPFLSLKGTCIVYLRTKKKRKNRFMNSFLVTANYHQETVEIPIDVNKKAECTKEDKFGCSDGRNIGKAILPLFAYNLLKKYENKRYLSDDEKKKAIELSISSGVLCKFTAYVGVSQKANIQVQVEDDSDSEISENCSYHMLKSCLSCNKCMKACDSEDSDDSDQKFYAEYKASTSRAMCRCAPVVHGDGVGRAKISTNMTTRESAKPILKESTDSEEDAPAKELKIYKKTCKKAEIIHREESSDSEKEEEIIKEKSCKKACKKKESKMKFRPTINKNKSSPLDDDKDDDEKTTQEQNCKKTCKKSSKMKFRPIINKNKSSNSDEEKETNEDAKEGGKMGIINEEEVEIRKSKPKRKPFDLMVLLRLQNFHGFWEDLDEINAMLGSDISSIKGVDVTPKKLNMNCVATILAVAALHMKADDQKKVWTMIEKKAIKWLKKNIKDADIDQLINDTESLI